MRSCIAESSFNSKRCYQRRTIQGTLPIRRETDIHVHPISTSHVQHVELRTDFLHSSNHRREAWPPVLFPTGWLVVHDVHDCQLRLSTSNCSTTTIEVVDTLVVTTEVVLTARGKTTEVVVREPEAGLQAGHVASRRASGCARQHGRGTERRHLPRAVLAPSLTTQDSVLRAGVHKYREILARTFCWPRAGQREQASAGHDNLRGASQLRTGRRLAPTTRP